MIFCEIKSKSNEVIFSNLIDEGRESDCLFYKTEVENHTVEMYITPDDRRYEELKKSSRRKRLVAEVYFNLHQQIEKDRINFHNRNFHTIKDLQARLSQKCEVIVEQNIVRFQEARKAKEKINEYVKGNIDETVRVFYDLNRTILEMDYHTQAMKILFDVDQEILIKEFILKKGLLAVYHPLKEKFKDRNLDINLGGIQDGAKVSFDKGLFTLMFHHFFDNASKYCKKKSEMVFKYDDCSLVVEMISRHITELENIYKDNYSTRGDTGLGLSVIKKCAERMGWVFEIIPGRACDDQTYTKNIFIFKKKL